MAMWYWYENDGSLTTSLRHPPHSRPIAAAAEWLTPPIVSNLHSHFARWTAARVSPGPVIPHRLWIDQNGTAAFRFPDGEPASMPEVGAGEALAQWLVLLSKWMEIHVVLARSRTVWPHSLLLGALPFITPSLLPRQLVQFPPDNWEQVARGLAATVAEGTVSLDIQSENGKF